MFNNFIGGGQVFLHKVRMFWQVFTRTIHIAFLLGVLLAAYINKRELMELDWQGFFSYRKAVLADSFDGIINGVRVGIGNTPNHITLVDAKTRSGILVTNVDPRKIIRSLIFRTANSNGMSLIFKVLIWGVIITKLVFILIFFLWSKFGKDLKAEKTKEGANKVLTAKEVARILRKDNIASDLKIGEMPLVKDMETMNFLVSGSIGSGKTNLMHNLLPQVNLRTEAAVIIDNTGEMIAKYYDPDRGDIIFNPFDGRSKNWDFWYDLHKSKDLEKFAEILIGISENIPLKAIIKNVSDEEAAIIQIKENEKVEISDYSKGMAFAKLQKDNKLSQDQLAEVVGCSKRKMQNFLSFDKISPDIWKAVSNMSKVSAKSAETIMYIANKSERHKAALIEIAEDIRKGAGNRRIVQLVDNILLGGKFKDLTGDLIQSESGQVFGTWKNGTITFSKNLNIDKKAFNEYLVKFFILK